MDESFESVLSPLYVVRWRTPLAGYEWRPVQDDLWLIAKGQEWRVYPVLASRRLLDRFGRLGGSGTSSKPVDGPGAVQYPTQDEILAFAQVWGPLTGQAPLPGGRQDPLSRALAHFGDVGDAYSAWCREAMLFAQLRALWHAVVVLRTLEVRPAGTRAERAAHRLIGDAVRFRNGWIELHAPGSARNVLDLHQDDRETRALLKQLKPDEGLVATTAYVVHLLVNEKLADTTRVAVHPFMDSRMRIWPRSLLGAIYLLFAGELSGLRASERWCEWCRSRPLNGPRQQRFCSDSCRHNHWYATSPRAATKRARLGHATAEGLEPGPNLQVDELRVT